MGNHHAPSRHSMPEDGPIPEIVGDHFKVGNKLGAGSFGVLYEGTNMDTNEPVAIKFESCHARIPQLREEQTIYAMLENMPGFPATYYFGREAGYNVLVLELLGPDLEELFELCGQKFSAKTVAMVARQMIRLLQAIHELGLLYRDVKPDNFLIGRAGSEKTGEIFMVDFGMAKSYRDPKTGKHIADGERNSLSGTARYMSLRTHMGREQSRRDDLESLAYVLLYFLRGALPWQGIKAANEEQKYERIAQIKQETPISVLTSGLPVEFSIFLHYARNLRFDETPDYDFCYQLFNKTLERLKTKDDGVYDWMLLNDGKGWEASERKRKSTPLMLTYH